MRQKIALFTLTFFASTLALAQSTCQTRVDAHQKATTPQRVEYCLTPEEYPTVAVSNPELIYAQVSSHEPAPTTQQKEYTSSNPYFDEGKYTIMQGYVGTSQFPQFQNATMSEQELAAQRKAWLERESALNQAQAPLIVRTKPTAVVMESTPTRSTVTTKPAVIISETKAGLTYRSHKPNRVMKQKGLVEETTVASSATTTTVETDLSDVEKTTEETLPQTSATQTSTSQTATTQTSTTQTTASVPEEKPNEDELGIPMNNPYAQPADLTNTDETIPYGEK